MYNEGISRAGDIIDLGSALDIITKRGAFYSFGDTRIGQGRENAKEFLRQNPELMAEIEKAVREQAMGGGLPMFGSTDEGESSSSEEEM
jgi:recombination protein RecA